MEKNKLEGRPQMGQEPLSVIFDSVPFLELLTAYGSPWGQQEL